MNSAACPRPEYPRPDFERTTWLNLNGEWEFDFDDAEVGEPEAWYKRKVFSRKILVPYCYQSKLSGIDDQTRHECMWYRRSFRLPEGFSDKRIFLNFGAVDYLAKVWINGNYTGMHRGGYTPFKIEITGLLADQENIVTLMVIDRYDCRQPRGKQFWGEKPDRCWYTASSGIWQSIWLEAVGAVCMDRIKLTPDIDNRTVKAEISLDRVSDNLFVEMEIGYKGNIVNKMVVNVQDRLVRITADLKEQDYVDEIHYWSPESPNLYDVKFSLFSETEKQDEVLSYFGMRKISVKEGQILLNNRPYYQKLVLDQGYWPDSLLTPPEDEAIVLDIEMTKKLGFNGARKHQKIEDPRYYYWADKLGLLVWGEMPSAYYFSDEEIGNMVNEWTEFIQRDYNHACIVTWVPMNESWGVRNIFTDRNQQDFAKTIYYLTKALDSTRLISTNDGWEQVESDICGIHDYEPSGNRFMSKYSDKDQLMKGAAEKRVLYAQGSAYKGQPVLITEYGGIAFQSDDADNWGYYGCVSDNKEFLERYRGITEAIQNTHYICGYCYTQLTDVQQEVNGLMTIDRRPKLNADEIRRVNFVT